jgi:hypothetical protein
MKHFRVLVVLMLVASPLYVAAAPSRDPLCAPLRAFVKSVSAGETQTIEFHTVWGGGFKSDTARTIYEKQCVDHGYQPAKVACKYLMQHAAIEFSGDNAERAVSCLSPATRFGSPMSLDRLDLSFAFGTPNRGSNITVSYGPSTNNMRGTVMLITAEGY